MRYIVYANELISFLPLFAATESSDNACMRSLAKSRATRPISSSLSVPIWSTCAEWGR